ncbi:MAG: ParA family protein [Gemmataceae bacterium]
MAQRPFLLAVGSHKGGTGRTTTALALAYAWGRAGLHVVLVDADPTQAAGLIACDSHGQCTWPNVQYATELREPLPDADVVIVDCPPLLDASASPVLQKCGGVLLTVLADPLSLRTVPAAASVLAEARSHNPQLELLGVLVAIYNGSDAIQAPMYARLKEMHGDMLVEPPIPDDPALRDWPLMPGSPPPRGPGWRAYAEVADRVAGLAQKITGVRIAPRVRRD